MLKLINYTILTLLFLAGSVLGAKLYLSGHSALSLFSFLFMVLTLVIFLLPKAYAFRFMYPGLVTFILFMMIPIFFTVYIGFTNLSTGHFLSKEQVYGLLKEETYIPEGSKNYSFKLLEKNSDQYSIFVNDADSTDRGFAADFPRSQKNGSVKLTSLSMTINLAELESQALGKGKIFQMEEELKKLIFIMPDGKSLSYYRSDALANSQHLYTELGDFQLKNTLSNEIYRPDLSTGFFTNNKENLAPGFFIHVGFSNFFALFTNDSIKKPFIKIFTWTMVWAAGSVFLTFCLGLFLTLVINEKGLKGKAVYRMFLIVPYSIPFFISVLVFRGLLNKDFGIINDVVSLFGIAKINWLSDPVFAKVSCLIVNLWLGFPYMFLVTTGILQSIPLSIYEAAALDGAGRWAQLTKITLPLIMSAVGPLLIGSFAFNLSNFVGIYLLTGGGPPMLDANTPAGETDILISYTYRLAFEGGQGQDFGLASAIALIIFFIIAILTVVNFKYSGMIKEQKT
ncbi:MAG: maltose ABC transporter permease MalF [Pseudomonadota bacterium]